MKRRDDRLAPDLSGFASIRKNIHNLCMFKRASFAQGKAAMAIKTGSQMKTENAITEESIRRMVDTFYDGVRRDEVLGPVFDRALDGGWDAHLPRMYDFWSTILLGTGRFQGNVFGKHMALAGITKEHFVRWLALFKDTVTRLYDEKSAASIIEIAERIAGSLQLGFFGKRLV
jgi:hemoglobin